MKSTSIHDAIFAVGALVLLVAMLPAVIQGAIIPFSTCLITGSVLLVFSINYATINYWYAAIVEAGNVVCWGILVQRALTRRNT